MSMPPTAQGHLVGRERERGGGGAERERKFVERKRENPSRERERERERQRHVLLRETLQKESDGGRDREQQ